MTASSPLEEEEGSGEGEKVEKRVQIRMASEHQVAGDREQAMSTVAIRNSVVLNPEVKDQVDCGTQEILKSPHISDGPGRIANSPVPSVYRDDRGSIHRLKVGPHRLNISFSKCAVMRSGYCHSLPKHCFVVSGRVEVWSLCEKGTNKTIYNSGSSYDIPEYVPHILHFLEDTVTMEWWTSGLDFRCWFYHPYRRLVDVQNSLLTTSTGQHHVLVPQDVFQESFLSNTAGSSTTTLSKIMWGFGGMCLGIGLSTLLMALSAEDGTSGGSRGSSSKR